MKKAKVEAMRRALKTWRLANNMTQEEVGHKVGLNESTIREFELGKTTPRDVTMAKIVLFMKDKAKVEAKKTCAQVKLFEDEPISFAEKLKTLRESAGWSQNKLSVAAGISSSVLGYYEVGTLLPQNRNLQKIAGALKISVEELKAGVNWALRKPLSRESLELGRRLRELRASAGWTTKKLSELVGCNYQTITNIERGSRNPSLEMLKKIAAALDVEVAELFAEERPRLQLEYKGEVVDNAKIVLMCWKNRVGVVAKVDVGEFELGEVIIAADEQEGRQLIAEYVESPTTNLIMLPRGYAINPKYIEVVEIRGRDTTLYYETFLREENAVMRDKLVELITEGQSDS